MVSTYFDVRALRQKCAACNDDVFIFVEIDFQQYHIYCEICENYVSELI